MEHNGHCEDVCVTVSLTPDDIYRAEKTYFGKRKKGQQRRIVFMIVLTLLPFATYLFVWWYIRIMRAGGWIDLTPSQVRLVTVILVVGAITVATAGIVYLVVRRKNMLVHVRRGLQYRASLCTYTFGEKIHIMTPSSESSLDYADIAEVIEDYYGYLIVPKVGALMYLPTRVLYGEELNRVKLTIKSKRSLSDKVREQKGA